MEKGISFSEYETTTIQYRNNFSVDEHYLPQNIHVQKLKTVFQASKQIYCQKTLIFLPTLIPLPAMGVVTTVST